MNQHGGSIISGQWSQDIMSLASSVELRSIDLCIYAKWEELTSWCSSVQSSSFVSWSHGFSYVYNVHSLLISSFDFVVDHATQFFYTVQQIISNTWD